MVDISHQHTRVRVNRNSSMSPPLFLSNPLRSVNTPHVPERWSDLLLLCQGLLTHLLCLPVTGGAELQSEHTWDIMQIYSISQLGINELRASKSWDAARMVCCNHCMNSVLMGTSTVGMWCSENIFILHNNSRPYSCNVLL